ncbi:MAG: hypothetical protein IT567_07120 [Alphaproteobacteria bacterium]|nr:hypothetical protein [Alphaproteobacteria bacterium]
MSENQDIASGQDDIKAALKQLQHALGAVAHDPLTDFEALQLRTIEALDLKYTRPPMALEEGAKLAFTEELSALMREDGGLLGNLGLDMDTVFAPIPEGAVLAPAIADFHLRTLESGLTDQDIDDMIARLGGDADKSITANLCLAYLNATQLDLANGQQGTTLGTFIDELDKIVPQKDAALYEDVIANALGGVQTFQIDALCKLDALDGDLGELSPATAQGASAARNNQIG